MNVPRTFRKREGLSDECRRRETPSVRKVLGVILLKRWWRPIIDTHLREMGGRRHDSIIPSDVISVVFSETARFLHSWVPLSTEERSFMDVIEGTSVAGNVAAAQLWIESER
jgi:hypothetical protein